MLSNFDFGRPKLVGSIIKDNVFLPPSMRSLQVLILASVQLLAMLLLKEVRIIGTFGVRRWIWYGIRAAPQSASMSCFCGRYVVTECGAVGMLETGVFATN